MKLILFTICLISASFSALAQNKVNYNQPRYRFFLTNNSIKFWQTENIGFINNHECRYGLYFAKDSTCDEFYIDDNNNRMFVCYDDIIVTKPFHFKLSNDSLRICEGAYPFLDRCCQPRYKILKLTKDSLIVQETYSSLSDEFTSIRRFHPSKNQRTKPKYWHELYPNDKSRWPYGTY